MIINLRGSVSPKSSKLEIEIPNVYFDRRYSYKVGVHHLYFELEQTDANKTMPNYDLLSLNTNLVDRSSANPTQTIFYITHLRKQHMIQFSKVATVVYYSLHLYELESATFKITRQFNSQPVDIKHIFIQIEILKVDAYGRV